MHMGLAHSVSRSPTIRPREADESSLGVCCETTCFIEPQSASPNDIDVWAKNFKKALPVRDLWT